jgi:transcriptional regulator with XRE-family HTH domain
MGIFPTINMEATGENIKKLRKKNRYSVRELQTALGLATPQAVYKWQQGVTVPDISNLLAMSKLFHVAIADILVCDFPSNITPFPARAAA